MALTREQRIEAAERRVKHNVDHKDQFGFDGARVLDMSKIPGGYKKEMFYKPKPDTYGSFDIIPFIVNNKNYPVKDMVGFPDYVLDVWVHRYVGASKSHFVCLSRTFGKPCPICEEIDELMKDKAANEELIKSMQPKRRCWYNVIDRELPDKEQRVQIFEESHHLFEKALLVSATTRGGGVIPFHDIEVGKTIQFVTTKKKSPFGEFLEYQKIEFKDRTPYQESIYGMAYPLDEMLVIPTYEEVRNAFYDISDEPETNTQEADAKAWGEAGSIPRQEQVGTASAATATPTIPRVVETPAAPAPERQMRPARTTQTSGPECPFGHKLGDDNGAFQDCNKCDGKIYDPCRDAYEKIMSR